MFTIFYTQSLEYNKKKKSPGMIEGRNKWQKTFRWYKYWSSQTMTLKSCDKYVQENRIECRYYQQRNESNRNSRSERKQ